jgi:flagellar biosynthetic protein FliQ
MEAQIVGLGIETMKVAMYLSFPALLVGMVVGLMVSIFQATTQINEMTLSFIPKIISIAIVMIFTMPWALHMLVDFTEKLFKMIPSFIQ